MREARKSSAKLYMSDIRKIEEPEIENALELAWEVFVEFEAPEYAQAGIDEFHNFVTEGWKNAGMTFYGAFEDGRIIGMLALRPRRHISLFFVGKDYQGKGVGKEWPMKPSPTESATPLFGPFFPIFRQY